MSITDNPKSRLFLIYLVCVAFSTLLWLLIMLDKRYTTDIPVKIDYKDIPINKVADGDLPKRISVKVSGRGFELIQNLLSSAHNRITINIGDYIEGNLKNNSLEAVIPEKEIRYRLNTVIPSTISIISAFPTSIRLSFTDIAIKKVPVVLNANINTKKQYIIKNSISLDPATVIVSGPKHIIDTIKGIYTKRLDLPGIWQKTVLKATLVHDKEISVSSKETEVGIEIERSTGAKRKVQIKPVNLPKGTSMKLFPGTVNIEYEVGLSRYDESMISEFTFSVDYKATVNGSKYLEISPARIPGYIKNLTYTPHRVEYIIE